MVFKNILKIIHSPVRCYSFLTKNQYPDLKRGNYAILSPSHIEAFVQLLGKNRVITDEEDLDKYNRDWFNTVRGYSSIVLKPKTTQEVSEIMKICHKEYLAVCPQGGNTSAVGGSVPVFDEVIISLSLMNKINEIQENSGVLSCQAGCVLEHLDSKVAEKGLMMPLDLGAKGSCQIGGNIATCAGGLRLLRYGSLSANVLGLEIVLANGEVLSMMNRMKKDNTGYPLRKLFVGSEGTLGIITGAVIQCVTRPKSISLSFIALESYENVVKTFRLAKYYLNETLSSCEMFDAESMESVMRLGLRNPIKENRFYMVIETHGSNSTHDDEKMSNFLQTALEKRTITDGTYTSQPSTLANLWQFRERIPESIVHHGYMYTYDLSLPLNYFYQIIEETRSRLRDNGFLNLKVMGCGHIGDGNIHILIEGPSYQQKVNDLIEPWLFEWTSERGGSYSAEHGMGFKKREFFSIGKSPSVVRIMSDIKKHFDPKCILNPYKVL